MTRHHVLECPTHLSSVLISGAFLLSLFTPTLASDWILAEKTITDFASDCPEMFTSNQKTDKVAVFAQGLMCFSTYKSLIDHLEAKGEICIPLDPEEYEADYLDVISIQYVTALREVKKGLAKNSKEKVFEILTPFLKEQYKC